ncbi:MAG: isopentenyl-diphosphate Delta-isomerase [Nanoarchaeota archaeon]
MSQLILVNEKDEAIGECEKIEIHKKGLLHRAFSIFIFNSNGKMLLQKRAKEKYHSGGLWTNACCGHPINENLLDCAKKRLKEELGFDCELKEIFNFHYMIKFENGLIENEIDHVLVGFFDGKLILNKLEAEDYKWITLKELSKDVSKFPEKYSHWFKLILEKLNF